MSSARASKKFRVILALAATLAIASCGSSSKTPASNVTGQGGAPPAVAAPTELTRSKVAPFATLERASGVAVLSNGDVVVLSAPASGAAVPKRFSRDASAGSDSNTARALLASRPG